MLELLGVCSIFAVYAQVSGSSFDCSVLQDGIYADPQLCEQYFVCTHGLTSTLRCLGGKLFNPSINKCDDPKNVTCTTSQKPSSGNPGSHTFNCTGKPSSFYASPYACDEYYICAKGQAILAKCFTGLLYNSTLKYCDLPTKVQCQPGQYVPPMPTLPVFLPPLRTTHAPTPIPIGTHSHAGSTLSPPLRTTNKLKTHSSTKTTQQQTTQMMKTSTRGQRVTTQTTKRQQTTSRQTITHARTTKRQQTIQQKTTHAQTTKHQQTLKPIIPFVPLSTRTVIVRPTQSPFKQYYTICRGRPDGLISDPSDCSHYYQCYFQMSIRMSCPYGTVFHQVIQACDYPQNVPGCH